MKPTSPEFIIVQVVESKGNLPPGPYAVVVGRCGDVPLLKGQILSAVYRYKSSTYPDEMGDEPIRIEEKPVRLEILEIQTHNRSFDQLGQGMTGALLVKGDGLDRLAPGWVIGEPVEAQQTNAALWPSPEPACAS